jgi:hypothetical protein
MRNDGVAVANRTVVVDNVRQLFTWGSLCIEDVFVFELELRKFQERKDFQPVRVIVSDSE